MTIDPEINNQESVDSQETTKEKTSVENDYVLKMKHFVTNFRQSDVNERIRIVLDILAKILNKASNLAVYLISFIYPSINLKPTYLKRLYAFGLYFGCFVIFGAATKEETVVLPNNTTEKQIEEIDESKRSPKEKKVGVNDDTKPLHIPGISIRAIVNTAASDKKSWVDGHNKSILNLKASKTEGQISLAFDYDTSSRLWSFTPLLIRIFDEDGNYLTHFTTKEVFTTADEVYKSYRTTYERIRDSMPDADIPIMLKGKNNFLVTLQPLTVDMDANVGR